MRKRISHKLTMEQKQKIWKLFSEGFSPIDIAKEYGISRITVYKIGKDEKYKN